MKLTPENIQQRYTKANSVKSTWDTQYEEIFDYCMPSRNLFDKVSDKPDGGFQDRRENLYSSVGEQSANEYVNTLQEVLAPPMTPWISVKAGSQFKDETRESVDKELEKLTDIANEYKNNSSFDVAFSEFCYDLFVGTACMLILPGRPRKPLSCKSVPLKEYCIEEGVDGEVRGVYRKYSMKRELLGAQWKELQGKKLADAEKDKDIAIIESTFYDYDLNVYHYQVIDSGEGTELLSREYKTNPFIVLRWNKCAGEPYGRGVGMTAINDIKTLNLIKYYSLRGFAYQLPILLAQEDAMLDVDNFDPTPLTLNIVPDTKNSIVPLDIAPKYEQESYKTAELTMDIKKNTYSSTLPADVGKNMTATEIRERIANLRKSLNSVAGRLISEGVVPITIRIMDVLGSAGFFGQDFIDRFNVNDINGLIYKVNVVTPIGKIIKYADAQTMLAAASKLIEIDPTGQALEEYIKTAEMIPDYLELSGLPLKYINNTADIKAHRQQVAEGQQAAMEQQMSMEVQADNQKSMGKAMANKEAMSG